LEILPEFSAGDSLSLLFFRNLLKSLSSFLDKKLLFLWRILYRISHQ